MPVPDTETTHKVAMAAVYISEDDVPFIVTESPSEVVAMMLNPDPSGMVKLTLGNRSEWNGKPLFVRTSAIRAVSPPKQLKDEDDDND